MHADDPVGKHHARLNEASVHRDNCGLPLVDHALASASSFDDITLDAPRQPNLRRDIDEDQQVALSPDRLEAE